MKYTLLEVRNTKSQVRGYWLDNGKLYRDNISPIKYKSKDKLSEGIKSLFNRGEKAVFYSEKQKGYCVNSDNTITIYNKRLRLHRKKLSPNEVKRLVKRFGGLTIYNYGRYIIEVYYN